MEEGRRSGEPSEFIVKNKSSSGCLIVRKKSSDGVEGVGSGSRKVFGSKEKRRPRMEFSDSGSSDELLMSACTRVGPETLRVCNVLNVFDKGIVEESDTRRKRKRAEDIRDNEVGMIVRNGGQLSERKRNKLDVFEFDEYDGNEVEMMRRKRFDDGGTVIKTVFGSIMEGGTGIERELGTGSSRHAAVDRRKRSYFERMSGLSRGDSGDRDGAHPPISFLRDEYASDEPIRVQGKNGVLKVMVNKKKKVPRSLNSYDPLEVEKNRRGLRKEDTVKGNVPVNHSSYLELKSVEKASTSVRTKKNPVNLLKSSSTKNGKVISQDIDASLEYESMDVETRNSVKTTLSTKNSKCPDTESEDSETSSKLGSKNMEAHKSIKQVSSGGKKTPPNHIVPTKIKEGKVKRGTGTEKQKLRERIRGMLQNAGWTIDYRPRRNRDYLDAVYISPTGTAYWSIIKAYDALLRQLSDEEDEAKSGGDGSPFTPLSDEVLSQLTRKTRSKIEKEMKKKRKDGSEGENAKATTRRKSSNTRYDEESMDSGSNEEKLSSFIKQGGKSLKSRINGNGCMAINSRGHTSSSHLLDSTEKPSSVSGSHHGRKSRKLGRCTLLVRNSNKGLNSERDTGKRTLLSWLIDCGAVQLSQKVRYMNRRRTKVMLEGWITRDGIHCGCCSKILTISKFEIHAGSKLRQPFQNIYLDSGLSLLECQIEAWNRQESTAKVGFHSVDIDGDDPDDDTCSLCGDGGDLICCDGCPSTFHQSCLDIKMLPPGDWHCPNCTCKFCGVATENTDHEDDTAVSALLTCSLCAKKYHESCMQEMDDLSVNANISIPCFCGKKCKELFEQLLKYIGVKHELEAGLSWSLIHRMGADLDTSLLGLPQRVECNSKLALALSVMNDCFLPIVDRRSGINLIHNVLYNCGSNFNRLNYSGFYAAILERGDEIISAASIRFHGTQLAEMPFVGTREIYRRQGMFRRLFGAIESALCSLNVEKLIIPAISELMHTWTEVFGFTTLDESLKQELKSMNMLVFPGMDMLQKQLLEQKNVDIKRNNNRGAKQMDFKGSQFMLREVANKSDDDSSADHDLRDCDNGGLEHVTSTQVAASQCPGASFNDTPVMSGSLDVALELKSKVSLGETINTDSESGEKLDESTLEKKSLSICGTNHELPESDNKVKSDFLLDDNTRSHVQGDSVATDSSSQCPGVSLGDASAMIDSVDVSHELQNPVSLENPTSTDSESRAKLLEFASGRDINADMSGDKLVVKKAEPVSPVKDVIESCEEGCDIDDAHSLKLSKSGSDELKISGPVEETKCADSQLDTKFDDKLLDNSDGSQDAREMETEPILSSHPEDSIQSYKGGDLDDADSENVDMARLDLEAVPSTKDTTGDGSSMQINSEHIEPVFDRVATFDVALAAAVDSTYSEASIPHRLGHGSVTDRSEV